MLRKILKHPIFIHFLVALGLFSLWGYIKTDNPYILMGIYLSIMGAICGGFVRVIDEIRNRK